MEYGCIGERLCHSFSKEIHNALASYEYSLKEYSPLIRNTLNYIQFNLNSELNVSSIAKYLCITPNHLYRMFKNEVGMSVIDYINKKRWPMATFYCITLY